MPTLVIIGAGPAGEAAAKAARRISASPEALRIVVVDKAQAGGLCLNRGCIPSKTLLERVRQDVEKGAPVSWASIQEIKRGVVDGIRAQLENSFRTLRIEYRQATASFASKNALTLQSDSGTETLSFDHAILATGTEAIFPPPLDQHRAELWDSDRALEITETPRSVAIVGGGAVGCEFACLLHAAGSHVTLVELKDQLLPGEDPAVASALAQSLEARGISVRLGVKVGKISKNQNGWSLVLSDQFAIDAERVLVCVGRAPKFDGLNLTAAGIETRPGGLVLNEKLQTTNPAVYAAGDAATTRLAHAAAAQGEVAAANALGGELRYDDRFVPRCLYSWPEVASIGAWKYQFEDQNRPVKTSRAFFKGSAKALAAGEADGFVQIVSELDSGKIAGAQIIGPHATELIHIFSVALKAGMTLQTLADTMFAHPTLGEMVRDAARK